MILLVITVLAVLSLFGMPWTYSLMLVTTYILSRKPDSDLSSCLVQDSQCSCVSKTLEKDKTWKQFRVRSCFGILSKEDPYTRKDLLEFYSNTPGGLEVCEVELAKARTEINDFQCDSLDSWGLPEFFKTSLAPIVIGGLCLFLVLRVLPNKTSII